MKMKYKLEMIMLLVTLMIMGISTVSAFPEEVRACNGCHSLSTSINVTSNVTSTLTVHPNQIFKVNTNWTGGSATRQTVAKWPTDFTNIGITRNNSLFNPTPDMSTSEVSPNGILSSTLTAPNATGKYIVRVYASTVNPFSTNFKDINITVEAPVVVLSTIRVSPSKAVLDVNGTKVFTATALDQNNSIVAGVNISWIVCNSAVGNVTPLFAKTGLDGNASTTFTALAIGNATVCAANGTVSGSANVIIGLPTKPDITIIVSPPTAMLAKNGTQIFNATAKDQNGTPRSGITIVWASNNTTVGNVSPLTATTDVSGSATTTFTAGAVGISMITANNGTLTGSANVTVSSATQPVLTTITVSPPTATLAKNGTQIFNAMVKDQNGTPRSGITIVWASNNTTVGNVSPLTAMTDVLGGATTTFTAGAAGIAIINATNGTVFGSANVNVTTVSPPTNVTVAIRTIEKESLRQGESTNITVDISSNISQPLSLREIIPAGWNITRVTDDSDIFKNSTNEWIWFNVKPGIHRTVVYRLTAPVYASIGTYHINGTLRSSSGVIAVVQGNNTITLDFITFYRRLGSDSDIVETSDVLTAEEDWRNNTTPAGFERAISTQEVLALIGEWLVS